MTSAKVVFASVLVAVANADIYLHNARGSNNRLDEARRDRNNANRIFDSQNNNRGGSNVGSLYYYEGEKLPLEWTNQHGCGNSANDCQIVVQYMCHDNLRDGVTTRTIPETPAQCLNNDCNTDVRYGMHESYDYYMNCKYRFRNRGLFNADRNLNGNTAKYTRQNNNGNRRGYECPEERDNYPYWHPTPWIDLAVMVNDPSRCAFYRAESENVKGREYCALPDPWYHSMIANGGNGRNGFIPNTQALCEALNSPGTPMTVFMEQRAAAATAEQTVLVNQELSRCNAEMERIEDLCTTIGTNESTIQAGTCIPYEALFSMPVSTPLSVRRWVVEADLDTLCPKCPAGQLLHPFSDCTLCTSTQSCTDAAFTAPINGSCPDGFEEDEDSSFCVTPECNGDAWTTLTQDELKLTDSCRSNILIDKFMVVENNGLKECAARRITSTNCLVEAARASWRTSPAHIESNPSATAPQCEQSQWSRPNHLGNGINGEPNNFNISLPSHFAERCAFRIRYNITTKDYTKMNPQDPGQVNSTLNKQNGNNPAKVNIGENFGVATISSDMPYRNARGYLWRGNPKVSIFDFDKLVFYCSEVEMIRNNDTTWCHPPTGNPQRARSAFCPESHPMPQYAADGSITPGGNNCIMCTDGTTAIAGHDCNAFNTNNLQRQNGATNDDDNSGDEDFRLQLAINTNQFGRTFQDRSHSYAVRPQPEEMKNDCKRIYALNVRGKRGNIVQTFPGTEYDFIPNTLEVSRGDCIHFQWTGSNTNPNNNDGQGKQGTDRSNIVLLEKVRGEGGRGVSRYGGKGQDGTTWTTANMEPGYEFYQVDAFPTMFDLQCSENRGNAINGNHVFNVPSKFANGWQCCSSCNHMDGTAGTATEHMKQPTMTGEIPQCDAGYIFDAQCGVCHRLASQCSFSRRVTNPSSYSGVGLDNRDSGFTGFSQYQIGAPDSMKFGSWGSSHPEHLDNVTAWEVWGLTRSQANNLATLKDRQFRGEMSELDDAGTYFDAPPQRITGALGDFYYMCTRNNNFSNRSQKGKVKVSDAINEVQPCSAIGCDVKTVDDDSVNVDNVNAGILILPKSIKGANNVGVEVMANVGLSDGVSDVVLISSNGPLSSSPLALTLEAAPKAVAGSSRHRREHEHTGLWVSVDLSSNLNQLDVFLKSPNSSLLSNMYKNMDDWPIEKRQLCVALLWPNQVSEFKAAFVHTDWDDVKHSWPIPASMRSIISTALESNQMWVDVQFPTANDTAGTCSGDKYTVNTLMDPTTGWPMTINIPAAAAISYGAVYHWPPTAANKACMQDSSCNLATADRSELAADCSGGQCVVQCSKGCNGYYQVSSENMTPMIIGIVVGMLLIVSMFIGSALYFRRNPEKWEDVKNWGPKKYVSLKRSMQTRI